MDQINFNSPKPQSLWMRFDNNEHPVSHRCLIQPSTTGFFIYCGFEIELNMNQLNVDIELTFIIAPYKSSTINQLFMRNYKH